MKKIYILIFAIILVMSSISAQNKKDFNKYHSRKTQYGFIENKGQLYDQNYKANPDVKYLLCLGNGLNVQLKNNSFSYDTYSTEIKEKPKDSLTENFRFDKKDSVKEITYHFHRVDVELPGSNTNPEIIAEDASADYMNFYNAVTPESGATYVRNYNKIIYKDIYPGIDMVFIAEPGKEKPVEYTFIVNPGADAKLIQLHYIGANETQLTDNTIKVEVAHGNFSENIPASWIKETNKKVNITYKNIDKDRYTFNIPFYSETHTLIIDPNPNLDWGTYYGGSDYDEGNGITCDGSGNVYVTGVVESLSVSGIATSGAHQTTFGGSYYDAFVLKCNSIGVRQWSTYYGGNNKDYGYGITCDNSGNVFVTGQAGSSNAIATAGAHKYTNPLGNEEAFIVKFNSNGIRSWGTYYGDSGYDKAMAITCNSSGDVIITGYTTSGSNIATTGAYKTTYSGGGDVFIAKFNTNGVLQWGTYYGGSYSETGCGITCDNNGNIFLTGITLSNTGIATSGAFNTVYDGQGYNNIYNGFVSKFNAAGFLQWGTYVGGYYGRGNGVACDNNGNVFAVGVTEKNTGIATSGAYQSSYAGSPYINRAGYLIKFNSLGVRIWGTYYGAIKNNPMIYSIDTELTGVTSDINGNVFITGKTSAYDSISTNFAYQDSISGFGDIFIAKFDNNGVNKWGTYYGGNASDYAYGIALDSNGDVFITGSANSTNGIATTGGFQTTVAGDRDVFVAKFSECDSLPSNAGVISGFTAVCQGQTAVDYTVPVISNASSYIWSLPSGATTTNTTNTISVNYGSSAVSGNITVKGNSGCGDGGSSSLAITVSPLPATAATITGSNSVCLGQTSVTYTVLAINNATSYFWTLPTGATGSSTTNTITVNYGTSAVSSNLSVYGANSCGNGASSTLSISVNSLPDAASAITGLTSVCQGQTSVTYTVPAIANATSYIWALPTGATGSSTTNTITVNYGTSAASGNITVKGSNACGTGDSSILAVTVNVLPGAAGIISGISTVCQGQTSATYTVPAITNATSYIWSFPVGATGTSTTNTITVNYGTSAVSGNITVKGNNSCGNGVISSLAITVNPLPATATTIIGLTSVCLGQTSVTYTVPAIQNATSYVWILPTGATGSSATNTITVNYGSLAVSGNITVSGNNSCGNGLNSSIPIIVKPIPATPIITQTGNTLLSNMSTGNQWYNLSSGIINNATSQTYNPVQIGNYFTIVTQNGCSSDSSNIIFYDNTGINEKNLYSDGFNIYPNPAKENLIIELIESNISQKTTISIYNIQGQLCRQIISNKYKTEVDIKDLSTGIYVVKVNNEKESIVSKFVKE